MASTIPSLGIWFRFRFWFWEEGEGEGGGGFLWEMDWEWDIATFFNCSNHSTNLSIFCWSLGISSSNSSIPFFYLCFFDFFFTFLSLFFSVFMQKKNVDSYFRVEKWNRLIERERRDKWHGGMSGQRKRKKWQKKKKGYIFFSIFTLSIGDLNLRLK